MASSCKAAARRLVRLFITKLSFIINQTNLLFDFFSFFAQHCSLPCLHITRLLQHFEIWLAISETLTFLIGLTFLIRFQNLTCYFWDFDIFYRFNFFLIKSNLTFPELWQPLNLHNAHFWLWLWLFGCDFLGTHFVTQENNPTTGSLNIG